MRPTIPFQKSRRLRDTNEIGPTLGIAPGNGTEERTNERLLLLPFISRQIKLPIQSSAFFPTISCRHKQLICCPTAFCLSRTLHAACLC
jgi:hypothetical protein